MKMRAHCKCPGIIEPFERIRPRTQPFRRDRRLLRRIGKEFLLPNPTLLVSLRSEGPGGVIRQFQFACIAREPGGFSGVILRNSWSAVAEITCTGPSPTFTSSPSDAADRMRRTLPVGEERRSPL